MEAQQQAPAAAAAGAAPFLPHGVVAALLAHVGRRERLCVCALVCRAWRDAAAAATDSISVRDATAGAFTVWLSSNGPQLTRLELSGTSWPEPQLVLPCQRLAGLVQLAVQGCDLGASVSGVPSLRRLTSLRLEQCALVLPTGLAPLSALTGLRQLQLGNLTVPGSTSEQLASSLVSALCQLQLLMRLQLVGRGLADDAVLAPSLSRLAQLRELGCKSYQGSVTAASLAATLPAPLTCVCLSSSALQLSASSSPGLAQLSGLQRLELHFDSGFEPALLAGWPVLRRLRLHCERWLPAGTQPDAGASALLGTLAKLPALEHLELSGSLAGAPAAAYSALVASSALTCLNVRSCVLPVACFASLFSRPLPRLRQLELSRGRTHGSVLAASDVPRLVVCCSQLQHLQLLCEEAGQALVPLTALGRLTSLHVAGRCADDWAAQHVLARLSALRELQLLPAPELTWAGAAQLTALRQLTSLWIARNRQTSHVELCFLACEDKPPVWQQLQQRHERHLNSRAGRAAAAQAAADALAAQLADCDWKAQAAELQQAASQVWGPPRLLAELARGEPSQLQQALAEQQARANQLQQQAASVQVQLSALAEQAEQTQAAASELEQAEPDSDSDGESRDLAGTVRNRAAGMQRQARKLQERMGSAAAQLGPLLQHLGLAQQAQQHMAALQDALAQRDAQLAQQQEQIAALQAQLAAHRH